jgi:RHS repeat-associated protein
MMRTKYFTLLLLTGLALFIYNDSANAQSWNPGHSIGTTSGVYNFSYNQVPAQFVEIYPAAFPNTGLAYQWESSLYPTTGFAAITTNGTTTSYQVPAALSQTTYFRRKTIYPSNSAYIYSNTIKITVVSVNWEDINYIREHDVITVGMTSWTAIDQLAIGSKLQTTSYLDGLGRQVEKVSRESATPASGVTQWGDMVRFFQYDALGRQPIEYLPYTTSNQTGKYKTTALTDQPAYFANTATYNETSAYTANTYDNSPLNRVVKIKSAGTSWAASAGDSANYDMNTAADNVEMLTTDYVQGDAPVVKGVYPVNTLYKLTYTDVNHNQIVEFKDMNGEIILKKVQVIASPGAGNAGWISTYNVYDDFGLLRFQIQPEGVKYLDTNAWSFAGTNGQTVLAEQVFQYNYDDKGRLIWKKAPGAAALNMIYDIRDRVVFRQDGNQAALATPQWLADCYNELDQPVLSALFNTTETIATLQSDLAGAAATVSIPITNTGNTGGTTVTVNLSLCPTSINSTSLNNTTTTSVLKYVFYDGYTFPNVQTFNTAYTNLTAYSTSDPNVMPIATDARAYGMTTGSLIRVLGTSVFLPSTHYYDLKGRPIQTLDGNIRSGTDITTQQYHFDGRLLSSCNSHTNASAGYTSFITLTKYIFDKLGRVTSTQKQLGSNAIKTISTFDYDDVGRVVTRHLDPAYNNPNSGLPDLESLNYTFNIHNQITGINKDFALKNPANYNKWGHFFGLYIGYDNRDNVFSHAQLNGQVTGLQWNTQGDDAQRKYDYTYDNSGRLIMAAYNEQQHPGDGWSNSKMDFSINGTSGQITYDNNGNLLTMLQKGVMPGNPTPFVMDDLRYAYNTYSNKLSRVTDSMTSTTLNGLSGDFKDGANAAGTPDYVYDANGNVVVDLNKNAQSLNNGAAGTNGISYNFMDKPDQIRIVGKGTIRIVYDGEGQKLQRVYIPESGGASTITTYINQFIYQETATLTLTSPAPFSGTGAHLAYMNFEQGRIRAVTTTSTNNGFDAMSETGNITLPGTNITGAWDYFILDYQQNVRMILTEETHSALNDCTMETTGGRPAAEDPVFGQTGAGNEVEVTRIATPSGWTGNTTASVSHLGNLSGHNIGPNTLQKVMAGDKVSAIADYYYQTATGGSNPNIVANVLANLVSLLGGNATAGTLVHANASNISSQLNATPGFVSALTPAGSGGTTPQAYLTILFFDERFNMIAASDGGVVQSQVASSVTGAGLQLSQMNIKAPKNGYVYAYLSNRSDQDVFFDNFKVTIQTGNIIEEDHYYAFGLKIAAISSHKLGDAGEGKLSNPYLYDDKEMLDEDAGLNWYDYGYRNYDPQIGRFMQLDPMTDYYSDLSPYQFAANDPIANIDIDGLEAGTAVNAASDFFQGSKSIDLPEVVIVGVRHATVAAAKTSSSVFSIVGGFLKGVGESAIGTIKGVGQMVLDPVGTATSILKAVANPVQTFNALKKVVVNTYEAFKNGTPEERATILGHLSGDIAQLFIGSGEAKIVEEGADIAKAGEEVVDIEKAGQELSEVEKTTATHPLTEKHNADWSEAVAKKSESHHGIPKAMKNDPAVKEMREGGFKYDGKENRHDIPKEKKEGGVFHAYHPSYTDQIRAFFKTARENPKWAKATPGQIAQFGREFNSWVIGEIKLAFAKGIKLNDIKLDFSTFEPTLFK